MDTKRIDIGTRITAAVSLFMVTLNPMTIRSCVRLAIVWLCAAPAAATMTAGVSPEYRLEEPTRGTPVYASAFDGSSFFIVWTRPRVENSGVWIARAGDDGELLSAPRQISSATTEGALAIAADGARTLVTWWERKQPSPTVPPQFEMKVAWIAPDGAVLMGPSTYFASQAYPASAAATVVDGAFIVAFATWLGVYTGRICPLCQGPGLPAVAARESATDVFLASQDGATLLVWNHTFYGHTPPCAIPEGCLEGVTRAQRIDHTGQLQGKLLTIAAEQPTSVSVFGDEFVVAVDVFYPEDASLLRVPLHRIDHAITTVSRGPTFDFAHRGVLASQNEHLVVSWLRGVYSSDVYFVPLDREFNPPPGLVGPQAFTLSSKPEREYNLVMAAGTSRILAVYTTETGSDASADIARSYVAYRTIDVSSLGDLPTPPGEPRVESASPEGSFAATVTLRWDSVPGGWQYRIIARVTDRDSEPVEWVAPATATSATLFLLQDAPYEVRLVVEDANGLSPPSAPVHFRMPANGPPRAPMDLTASLNADGTVTLRWRDMSTSEEGFYVSFFDELFNQNTIAILPAGTTSFTFRPTTRRFFFVEAFNAAGRSMSNSVAAEGVGFPRRRAITRNR